MIKLLFVLVVINLVLSVFVLYQIYQNWLKESSSSSNPSPSPSSNPSLSESPSPSPSSTYTISILLSPKQLNNLPTDILDDYYDAGNKIIKSEQLLINMGKEEEYRKLLDSWNRINDLMLMVASNPDQISTVHDNVIKALEKISNTLNLLLSIPSSTSSTSSISRCLPGDC
jgi:hypothetical protein